MVTKGKADFEYLVVGCSRTGFKAPFAFHATRKMFNYFQEPQSKAYHDLHANDDFYHIDINDRNNPDQAVDFFNFQPATDHQYKLILTEHCSLFANDVDSFIKKCNELLCDGGILLIRGVLPEPSERKAFEASDYSCCYESFQNKHSGWSIYFKGDDNSLLYTLSDSARELIEKSGYEIPQRLGYGA